MVSGFPSVCPAEQIEHDGAVGVVTGVVEGAIGAIVGITEAVPPMQPQVVASCGNCAHFAVGMMPLAAKD